MIAHDKESDYLRIRRKYRIEVSDELKDFWGKVENENLYNNNTHFHFHVLKILSLQNVIDFDVRYIMSWFKEKARLKYITYYIPIAEVVNSSNIIIAGYDQYKQPKGLFLFNNEIEPVFITKELHSLFSMKHIQHQYGDDFEYIKDKVLAQLLFEENYKSKYDDDYEDGCDDNTEGVINFIKYCTSRVHWGDELNIERKESSIEVTFKDTVVTRKVEVEYDEFLDHDEIVYILNFINSYIWTSSSVQVNYYGFYKIDKGIVFLSHDELIEFVRKGVVRFYFNVEMPACVYIDRVNMYKDEPATEEEKALMDLTISQVIDYYENAEIELEVKKLKRKDIDSVLDHYFDAKNSDLVLDGIDELKLKSEEDFYLEIDKTFQAEQNNEERVYLSWFVDKMIKGHAYFEHLDSLGSIQLQFYYREIKWRKEEVHIELFDKSVECVLAHFNPKTIISKVNQEDTHRINILVKNGFEQKKVEKSIINEIGLEQSTVVFEKNMQKHINDTLD